MLKHPKEGGTGIRDPIAALDARRVGILKKIIIRNRQPWMKWIQRKLMKVAAKLKEEDPMAAKPTQKEQRELNDKCITESALKTWIEIGGMKEDEKIVTKKKGDEITLHWESGYGVNKDEVWIPIERLTSKICYDIIIINRTLIKECTPNPAHVIVCEIDKYLTPEERNYWWILNHNLILIFKKQKENIKEPRQENQYLQHTPSAKEMKN